MATRPPVNSFLLTATTPIPRSLRCRVLRTSSTSGIAWNKFAVRSILINPRYTGFQVWNKQRKDEVLIDVEDVALGHTTKLRWNDGDKWLWSKTIVPPA